MQSISNTQTCALSQFYDWLTCRNVRVIDSWLLLSLPAGGGSAVWWWPRPVLRGLCVTGMPVSGYSLLPPPSPPTLSRIMDHKTARVRGGRVTGRLNALWSSCVMRSVNSWRTCSDARNISRYNSSRFDTIHEVSVPIRYRSDNRPFSSIFCSVIFCMSSSDVYLPCLCGLFHYVEFILFSIFIFEELGISISFQSNVKLVYIFL